MPLWWPSQRSLPILTSHTAEESRAAVAQCGLNVDLQSSGILRGVLESKWPVLLKHIKVTIDKDRQRETRGKPEWFNMDSNSQNSSLPLDGQPLGTVSLLPTSQK